MFGKKKRIEEILFKETATEKKGEINITRYLSNNGITAVEYTLPEIDKISNKVRVTRIKPQHFVTYLSTNMRFDPYNDRPQGFYGHGKTEEEALLESEKMWNERSHYINPFTKVLDLYKSK